MSEYSVVTAEEDEWEDAMALAYRTFRKFEGDVYTPEGVQNFVDFISDNKLFRMFQEREYHLWVAKDAAGTIIGMGSLRSGNHISLLFVDEKWHKRGVGRAIMTEMENYVKAADKQSITVNSSPYAVDFYHKLGFEDLSEEQLNSGMYITPMRKIF